MAAWYRAADIALVTPLRDGMNLVAKEYVACHPDGDGVLVLSEFAGAARELTQAILVNPYEPESICRSIETAVQLGTAERARPHAGSASHGQHQRHPLVDDARSST